MYMENFPSWGWNDGHIRWYAENGQAQDGILSLAKFIMDISDGMLW
jgi:hypothetical protein